MLQINYLLAFFVCLFLLSGCAENKPYEKTSQVEIYRTTPVADSTMRELCRQVKLDADLDNAHKRIEVEEYTKNTAPGETEYRREYRESSRYSEAAKDRDKMIELCTRMD